MSTAGASSMGKVTVMTKVKLSGCGNCGKESSQCCGNCRKESYCSVICQKARRKQHKQICFPAKEELGFGLREGVRVNEPRPIWVATRDIKEGERIFTDYPLMIGPGEKYQVPLRHICLGCHMILKDFVPNSDHRKCGDCGWPLCGLTCSGVHRHLKECTTLVWMGGKKEFINLASMANGEVGDIYEQIRYIRLLALIKDDPTKWERFLDLGVPQCFKKIFTGAYSADMAGLERGAVFLKFVCQLPELTKETMLTLKITEMYHHKSPHYPKEDIADFVIYDKESKMDISCLENCYVWPISISKKKDAHYGLVFTAAKSIQEGQRLSMTFHNSPYWDGTKRRRERLMRNAIDGDTRFTCKCIRCSDPTELGTNLSAVKCTKCKSGHLLPLNPLDDKSKWKCNKVGCRGLFPASDVDKVVNKIQRAADDLTCTSNAQIESSGDQLPREFDLITPVAKFVQKYEKILSPNHYILLNIQKQVMDAHNYMLICLVRPDLPISSELSCNIDRYQKIAETFFDVANKLYPPLSLQLLEAHSNMGMSKFFSAQQAVRNEEPIDVVQDWLKNGISHLRIVMDFKIKTSLPLNDLGFDTIMKRFEQAYNNAIELSRLTPNYNGIPEKMVGFDQIVSTTEANERTATAEKI